MEIRYTVESVMAELKQLLKEDIPEEYKNWARDGITYVDRNPDPDVQDYPNNIFGYIHKVPMPQRVRELIEGILLQGIEQGSGVAACNLGALYYSGEIGEQSYAKAMEYYQIGAEAGNEKAIENLGYCYYYGRDCDIDYQKAFECFSKGAFTGRTISLYKIGDMYRNGYYVEKNEKEACRIYSYCIDIINNNKEEAAQSDADVYVRYAECLLNGIGCEPDTMVALYWAQRAEYAFRERELRDEMFARQGIEWAMKLVSQCRNNMDSKRNIYQPC